MAKKTNKLKSLKSDLYHEVGIEDYYGNTKLKCTFNSLHAGFFLMKLLSSAYISKLIFQEQYRCGKQFAPRSGPKLCSGF